MTRDFQAPESTDTYHFLLFDLIDDEPVGLIELDLFEELSALIVNVRFHALIY